METIFDASSSFPLTFTSSVSVYTALVNYIGIASGVNWTTHEQLLCGHRPQYHRQPHLQLGQLTITKTNTLAPVIIGWALASLFLHCGENRISVANVQNFFRYIL